MNSMSLRSHANVVKIRWGQSLLDGNWQDILYVHVNLTLDPEDAAYHAERVNNVRQAVQEFCGSYPELAEVRILED